MSGLVFVLDAQGQPLMPLAEAHARKLLRNGKARRWPHPTLTIIQLTRLVETPILRPVLLGVVVHRTAAELFALTSGPQAVFPLLSLVIDLPRNRRSQRGGAAHRWQRVRRPTWRQLLDIGSVISALWGLLPLSHIAILRTPALRAADPDILRRLRHYLTVGGIHIATTTPDLTAPAALPHNLFALLIEFVVNPEAYAPVMAARSTLLPQNRTKLTRWSGESDTDDLCSGIGVVTKPPLVGIIDCESTPEQRVLEVAVAAGPNGVTWRYVAIAPQAPFQRWPLSRVVLLPLVSRKVQATVKLEKNRWDAYAIFQPKDRSDATTLC